MADSEFIVIDFGVAWTKAFHLIEEVADSQPTLTVRQRFIVPTSVPDLEISYKELLTHFNDIKKAKVILTSSFCKKEAIEAFSTNPFIDSVQTNKALTAFFGRAQYDVLFLEGGGSNWLQNFEPGRVCSLTQNRTTEIEVENYLGNKRRFLFTVPLENKDSDIEVAYLKNYLLSRGLAEGGKNTLVIATGGILSHSKNHKQVLEIIADRLSLPFCQILVDTSGVLPCFGALLAFSESKKEILQVPSLISLAALINLGGEASVNLNFGFADSQDVHVGLDELILLPAEKDKEVIINSIKSTSKSVKVEKGKQLLKTNLTSGMFGILLDGRSKPLDLPAQSDLAKEKIKKWQEDLNVAGVI